MRAERRYIDEKRGNGLFAKQKIPKGSTIFEELPLICAQFSWNETCGYKACEHCLTPLESAQENAQRLTGNNALILPFSEIATKKPDVVLCNNCGVEYCSQECLSKAFQQYHGVLCKKALNTEDHPLDILMGKWRAMHYPPETSTIMIVVKILATIVQAVDKEATQREFLKFCHRTVNEDIDLAHKLIGEKFVDQIGTLNELVTKVLSNEEIKTLLSPSGFHSLLAMVGTNGQGIGTSSFSHYVKETSELGISDEEMVKFDSFVDEIYEQMDKKTGMEFLNNEGVGLYALQSSCNHSCTPNAEPSFLCNNSTLSLVAMKDIEDDEEICISYLDECLLQRSRHSRQKELKENYLFICNCAKCLSQCVDSDVTSEEDEVMSE